VRDLDVGAPGAPVASVVIPVYNQKPEVLRAAVKSALAQTVPVEVIVVDDGSDVPVSDVLVGLIAEDGVQVGASLRIHAHPGNQGISAALNTGIADMTTDWFAWLSSDDLFDPRKVEYHLASLLAADAKAGYTGYNLVFDNGNMIGHVVTALFPSRAEQMKVLGRVCAINGSTVMIHRSVFDSVGLFDADYRYGQDWEFWCRAGERFFWHGIPDKLTTRREFGNLTARLNAKADPVKTAKRDAEDAAIRKRYGLHGRALAAVVQATEVCREAGHAQGALHATPCTACLAGIVERAF
jgi:glycosyltransferase involved in cell wall biosynthesis